MSQRIQSQLAALRAIALIAFVAACGFLSGCAHPISVKVIDSVTQAPIHGASITRNAVLRPYFIVGTIAPVEQSETDSEGVAYIKGREGSLEVNAAGFVPAHIGGLDERDQVVVELNRLDNGG